MHKKTRRVPVLLLRGSLEYTLCRDKRFEHDSKGLRVLVGRGVSHIGKFLEAHLEKRVGVLEQGGERRVLCSGLVSDQEKGGGDGIHTAIHS